MRHTLSDGKHSFALAERNGMEWARTEPRTLETI
jgi:hypothetical protein